jgi:hypothetical protein
MILYCDSCSQKPLAYAFILAFILIIAYASIGLFKMVFPGKAESCPICSFLKLCSAALQVDKTAGAIMMQSYGSIALTPGLYYRTNSPGIFHEKVKKGYFFICERRGD